MSPCLAGSSRTGELLLALTADPFGELDMLVPAYAATIHKSQGSEYPAVIIPVLTQHYLKPTREERC